MNNWQTLNQKTVYKNNWLEVKEDQVLRPDGNQGTYAYVDTFKPFVAIVPIDNDGIYLIKNYRYPIKQFSLEIPQGGSSDKQGNLIKAAQEELQEETGLTATKWTELPRQFSAPAISTDEGIYFIAQDLIQGERHLDGNEQIQDAKKYSFHEVKELIKQGEIVQTITISGIFVAMNYLRI